MPAITLHYLRRCANPKASSLVERGRRAGLLVLACAFALALTTLVSAQGQGSFREISFSEVQAFVERLTNDGFPLDEVVASALEHGYKPELVSAALATLKFDPVRVAVTLVSEGVARAVAAVAVIVVSDPAIAPAVKAAVSVGASETEIKAIEAVTPTTPVPETKKTSPATNPAPTQEAPAESQPVTKPLTTAEPAPTEPVPIQSVPVPEPVPVAQPVPVPEPVPQPVPEPVAPVAPVVTPPIMGGGGGATRN